MLPTVNYKKGHLPQLDPLRGIAILSVFLFHSLRVGFTFDQLPWAGLFRNFDARPSFLALYPLTYGWAGVAIFFVLSGFCIHLSYHRSKELGWGHFFCRRFFRIYPAYFLAVLLFSFVWPWTCITLKTLGCLKQLFSHLLAVHNLHVWTFSGINGSFWSIGVELQLYLVYPLWLWIVRKSCWSTGLLIALGIESLIRLTATVMDLGFGHQLPALVGCSPFGFWFSWALGAYLAQAFIEKRGTFLSRTRFDLVLLAAVGSQLFLPTLRFSFPAFALLTAVVLDRLLSGRWELPKNRVFLWGWKHLTFLGAISYSFYLLHQPIILLTRKLLGLAYNQIPSSPLSVVAYSCAWYPVILLVAYGAFRLIEQPSIALGKTILKIRSRARTTPISIELLDVPVSSTGE